MPHRPLTALAAALAAVLALCAPASASRTQESIIQDDTLLLSSGDATREATLDDVATLGADTIRVQVIWSRYAPDADAARAPAGFTPEDPAAYPARSWEALDDVVRGAAARGIRVLLSPSSPIPRWASRCSTSSLKQLRSCRPDPALFGGFVRALGTRYSGSYRGLPRVDRWSIWNEPNRPNWLRPQYGPKRVPLAPRLYRDLARSGIAALRATGHQADRMMIGETAPIGISTGLSPVRFVRELFCMDAAGRAFRGAAARARGCTRFAGLGASGYAHHPYTAVAFRSPAGRSLPTSLSIQDTGRLVRLLDQAARLRRAARRMAVYYTEFGFQTPPDRYSSVAPATQAEWLNWADYLAFRQPRVRSVAQYLIDDDARTSEGFQTGLRYHGGTRRKPSWAAYRLPVYVVRARRGADVYGQLRAAPGGGTVRIHWRATRRRPWREVARRNVGAHGHLLVRVSRATGQYRLVAANASSRVATVRRR